MNESFFYFWYVIISKKVTNASPASKGKKTTVQSQHDIVHPHLAAFKRLFQCQVRHIACTHRERKKKLMKS